MKIEHNSISIYVGEFIRFNALVLFFQFFFERRNEYNF